MPKTKMMYSGIIPIMWSALLDWRQTPYIVELKQIFESMHEKYQNSCISAVGVLCLTEKETLYPKYIMETAKNTYKEIVIEKHTISMSDLRLYGELAKEIKKDGFLIVTKFIKDGQ